MNELEQVITKCFDKHRWVNKNCKTKYAQELSEDGITFIEEYFSEDECEMYYTEVVQIINNTQFIDGKKEMLGAQLINRGERWNTDYNMIDIFDADKILPAIEKLRSDRFILDIINDSNTLELKLQNLNIYYTKQSKPRVLHIDNFNTSQYKAFILLTDVLEWEQGPHMHVKGSHLCSSKKILSYLENIENNYPLTDMRQFSYDDATPCFGKKGTLVITDKNGVHGAYPQSDNQDRMLIMLNYGSQRIEAK